MGSDTQNSVMELFLELDDDDDVFVKTETGVTRCGKVSNDTPPQVHGSDEHKQMILGPYENIEYLMRDGDGNVVLVTLDGDGYLSNESRVTALISYDKDVVTTVNEKLVAQDK